MKLSELISYVNTINGLTTSDIKDIVDVRLRELLVDMNNNGMTPDLNAEFLLISESAQKVLDDLEELNSNLGHLRTKIKVHRTEYEVAALQQSYKIYEGNQNCKDKTGYLFNTHLPHLDKFFKDDDVETYLNSRLKLYGKWQHPAAIIRPLGGDLLESMIAADVLYVLDEEPGLLNPTRKLFTPEYQVRLRYKLINESRSIRIKHQLPAQQLGFIFVNEFFHFRTLEVIKEYLIEMFEVLSPGGVVLFTYNNCDLPGAVRNFEAGMYCYTPATLLRPMVEALGYEVISKFDNTLINKRWLEIKKPGQLTTIKGGQTLAEIVKKTDQTT